MNKLREECPEKWKVVSSQLFWLWVYITLNQPLENNSLSTNNARKIDWYEILGNYPLCNLWVIGLGEGGVGSYNLPPVQLYFHLTGLLTAVWHWLVSVYLKMKAYNY